MSTRPIPRRAMLTGAAVALCLPWLETFASRDAGAAVIPVRRYLSMYFPNGVTNNFWLPPAPGLGEAWSITPILEPLAASKQHMLLLQGVGNYSAFGPTTISTVSPSHGTNCAGAWHCFDGRKAKGTAMGGGISVDQVIAKQIGSLTALPSLQIGLSTVDSQCDGTHCAYSRSISWSGPEAPLYKIVNPQAVFDRLITAGARWPGSRVCRPRRIPSLLKCGRFGKACSMRFSTVLARCAPSSAPATGSASINT